MSLPMTRDELIALARPGDALLYRGLSPWGAIIRLKTWSPVSHCELYVRNGVTMASRERKGVNYYAVEPKNLFEIWRPHKPWNIDTAMAWFNENAKGQGYDYLGLLRFVNLGEPGLDKGKQFCSEVMTRAYRHGDIEPFTPHIDADQVPPSYYRVSPEFFRVYAV